MNDNPALSSVSSSNLDATAANIGDVGAIGGASLNLRGLGIERTLTVVNGRRHVAGFEGTSAVDGVHSPGAYDRVEVLTGGSSAIYGADAVTGGSIYSKDDFEGVQFDFQPGISGETDNESYSLSAVFGRNFADGKGNVTVAVQYDYDDGLKQGDRNFFREDGVWNNDTNPALRFQTGDIDAGATPNFSAITISITPGCFPLGRAFPPPQKISLQITPT